MGIIQVLRSIPLRPYHFQTHFTPISRECWYSSCDQSRRGRTSSSQHARRSRYRSCDQSRRDQTNSTQLEQEARAPRHGSSDPPHRHRVLLPTRPANKRHLRPAGSPKGLVVTHDLRHQKTRPQPRNRKGYPRATGSSACEITRTRGSLHHKVDCHAGCPPCSRESPPSPCL
jgi:hypothetical protein